MAEGVQQVPEAEALEDQWAEAEPVLWELILMMDTVWVDRHVVHMVLRMVMTTHKTTHKGAQITTLCKRYSKFEKCFVKNTLLHRRAIHTDVLDFQILSVYVKPATSLFIMTGLCIDHKSNSRFQK